MPLAGKRFDTTGGPNYDCGLMSNSRLPEHLVHDMFTEAGTPLEGRLPRALLARLSKASMTEDAGSTVSIALRAWRDDQGRKRLSGSVQGHVTLLCQRCLQHYEQRLEADVELALVASEKEAEALPVEFDPLVMETGKLMLASVVEDELLLAMPVIARHADGECTPPGHPAEPLLETTKDNQNPFAVLERLKKS